MKPSSSASLFTLNPNVPQAVYPTPVTGKLSEQRQEEETDAWLERINMGMKRMTEDENYRREIARDLS